MFLWPRNFIDLAHKFPKNSDLNPKTGAFTRNPYDPRAIGKDEMKDSTALLNQLVAVSREAGAAILNIYSRDFEAARKSEHSPVTEADTAAEALIVAALAHLAPGVPVVAEEHCAAHGVPAHAPDRFFLVDPLDGTKEFIAKNGEFTVNVALIENGWPILGVVYLPVFDACYTGAAGVAERRVGDNGPERITARPAPNDGLVMAISRSHADGEVVRAKERGLNVASTIVAGSSLKFCRLAEGLADLYPRFGTTMEWDTAAGQAVLEAAGGRVETVEGERLSYGKAGFKNPHFIAYGRQR
jgi:3'(2'), 5'-bisphosphate nucleotidase